MNRVVPAIDILDNKVVRLTRGDYNAVTYYEITPLEAARKFEKDGFSRIHIVDLEGARSGKFSIGAIIGEISKQTSLVVQCSGGIRSEETCREAFAAGADLVCVGSIAVEDTEATVHLLETFPARIIVAADCMYGTVRTHGWKNETSLPVETLISRYAPHPVAAFLVTDIEQDGMMTGVNRALYRNLRAAFPAVRVIASGGVSTLDEAEELLEEGVYQVVVGKALYERPEMYAR
jgi:phosphoribosylformimino-5-aminoimidazole carboxamide ribotide isomerase